MVVKCPGCGLDQEASPGPDGRFFCPKCGAKLRAGALRTKRRSVVVDDDLVSQIAVIAGSLGMNFPDFVNNRLRVVVASELPGVLARLESAAKK